MASFRVDEQVSKNYFATMVDGYTLDTVGPALLTTLTLTLYDKATGSIINSRNGQSVLNANDVLVYDAVQTASTVEGEIDYNLLWAMRPADNAIVTDSKTVETHIALFQATWAGGQRSLKWEVEILVKNLAKVS